MTDPSDSPPSLRGTQPRGRALREEPTDEEADAARVASGIEAGKLHRAKVLARSPLARLSGFKPPT